MKNDAEFSKVIEELEKRFKTANELKHLVDFPRALLPGVVAWSEKLNMPLTVSDRRLFIDGEKIPIPLPLDFFSSFRERRNED